jgi:hypothetical protein
MTESITLETRYILGLSGRGHNKALQRTRTRRELFSLAFRPRG